MKIKYNKNNLIPITSVLDQNKELDKETVYDGLHRLCNNYY